MTGFDPAWEIAHRRSQWGWHYDPRLMTMVWRRYAFVEDRNAVKVLDIGCGVGAQTFELARWGYSVAGIDAAPSAISRANEIWGKFQSSFDFRFAVADVTALEVNGDGAIVDCITDACCLEVLTVEHATVALRNIVKMLKPDGTMMSIHKADGWQDDDRIKVGAGSRWMSREGIREMYGEFFDSVKIHYDEHTNYLGNLVPEWLIECSGPRKNVS